MVLGRHGRKRLALGRGSELALMHSRDSTVRDRSGREQFEQPQCIGHMQRAQTLPGNRAGSAGDAG